MSFLIRKINKRALFEHFKEYSNVNDMCADLPTSEFRTRQGTLSTWKVDSMDDINEAMLAIIISSSEISKMDFIVIDTNFLDELGLEYKHTDPGMDLPIPELSKLHYDIVNISLKKITLCAELYKRIYIKNGDTEEYVFRLSKGEVKDRIISVLKEGRIDITKANNSIKEVYKTLYTSLFKSTNEE